MGSIIRPLAALFVALASVAALPVAWTLAGGAVALTANTTALIMGGTLHPLIGPRDTPGFVTGYLDNAVTGHLDPVFGADRGPVTNAVAVFTPEDFFPLGRLTFEKSMAEGLVNLHHCLAATADCLFNDDPAVNPGVGTAAPHPDDTMGVFGYSQSAAIASLAKRSLIAGYQPGDPSVSFTMIANPMRPNGGILMRFFGWPAIPLLGIPFPGASSTDGPLLDDGTYAYPTVDVVRQYDGLGGDFPVRPLNLIATVNALLGYGLLHGETVDVPFEQASFQGREGDTGYYLIETEIVPLLQPLVPFVPKPILAAIDAPLRVIIEDAYDRDIGPGVPTRANWWPVKDLVGTAAKLIASIPVAVDNFTEELGFGRVLGTPRPGTFGVGGPQLPAEDVETLAERVDRTAVDEVESVVPQDVLERPGRLSERDEGVPRQKGALMPDAEPGAPDDAGELEDVTEDVTEDAAEDVTDDVPEDTADEVTDDTADDVTDDTAGESPGRTESVDTDADDTAGEAADAA